MFQDLVHLRRLNLRHSLNLRKLPDFSKAHNLVLVDLAWCESLSYVHQSLLSLPILVCLDLEGCKSLECFPRKTLVTSLISLLALDLSSLFDLCYSIKLPRLRKVNDFSFENLKCLNLVEGEMLTQVLSSLPCLPNLVSINFEPRRSQTVLPSETLPLVFGLTRPKLEISMFLFGHRRKLETLLLDGSKLKNLPMQKLGHFIKCFSLSLFVHRLNNLESPGLISDPSLGKLTLTQLCSFRFLGKLRLHEWTEEVEEAKLNVLFDALPFLEELHLEEWSNLAELPNNISHPSRLQYVSSEDCTRKSVGVACQKKDFISNIL